MLVVRLDRNGAARDIRTVAACAVWYGRQTADWAQAFWINYYGGRRSFHWLLENFPALRSRCPRAEQLAGALAQGDQPPPAAAQSAGEALQAAQSLPTAAPGSAHHHTALG
jgi:hypothetical protein